jgi:hypothetical protein
MRTLLFATAFALALAGWEQSGAATIFDPTGKWTYSSQDEQGGQAAGTMTISGKPGSYTGTITTGQGQDLPITDVLTSANGMIVLASLPDGATAVIKVAKKADGKLEAGWAPLRSLIPAVLTRAK